MVIRTLKRFCLETVLFHQLGVNMRICLCGVKYYASAQMLDFLDLAKKLLVSKSKTHFVSYGISRWALNSLLLASVLLFCFNGVALACFGPKLFVAAGQSPEEETLFALVTLYVEEKTGVESNRVIVERDDPLALIAEDKADLVFTVLEQQGDTTVFVLDGLPALVTGKRPVEDLQFTTVLPAIKKLQRVITGDEVMSLIRQVKDGGSAMAVVRKYFMERRLI
jgi:hypothetical protein